MSNWSKERKKDLLAKIFLFTISPFASCLYSLRRLNTKSSYFVFFITSALFGLAFSVPNIRSKDGIDGTAYRIKFENYIYTSEYEFKERLLQYLSFDSSIKDFYSDIVAFYTSRFTENYHVMFMIFATIFSYFMLKSLKFLTNNVNFNHTIISYILVYLFTFNQIFNINGVRFWTAAWIATYCILQIVYKGNKKYYALALLTPFFHGSYFLFIAMLLLYAISKKLERLWVSLFIFSFIFSSFATTVLTAFIERFEAILPSFIVKLTSIYTNPEYIEEISSKPSLISIISQFSINSFLFIIVFLFIRHSKTIKTDNKTYNLYIFTLIWISTFNFLLTIPSLGGRFMIISYPLIALIWLNTFKSQQYKYYILILPIIFMLKIRSQIVYYSMVLDPTFYLSPSFLIMYKYLIDY